MQRLISYVTSEPMSFDSSRKLKNASRRTLSEKGSWKETLLERGDMSDMLDDAEIRREALVMVYQTTRTNLLAQLSEALDVHITKEGRRKKTAWIAAELILLQRDLRSEPDVAQGFSNRLSRSFSLGDSLSPPNMQSTWDIADVSEKIDDKGNASDFLNKIRSMKNLRIRRESELIYREKTKSLRKVDCLYAFS